MSEKRVSAAWIKAVTISCAVAVGTVVPRLSTAEEVAVDVPMQIAPLAAGQNHSLARCENGLVFSWGSNASGQLGDGTGLDAYSPVAVRDEHYEPAQGFAAVASGDNHALALKLNGSVLAWGANDASQVFDTQANLAYASSYRIAPDAYTGPFETAPAGTTGEFYETPVSVLEADTSPATEVRAVAADGSLSVALRADGSVIAWGNTGFLTRSAESVAARENGAVSQSGFGLTVGADGGQANIQDNDQTSSSDGGTTGGTGDGAGDGSGDSGQLAESSVVNLLGVDGEPVSGVVSVAAGDQHILGRLADGRVLVWDRNTPINPALLREGGERAAFAQNNQNPEDDSPYFDPSKVGGEHEAALRAVYLRDAGRRIISGVRQISSAAGYSVYVMNNGQVMASGNSTIPFFSNGVNSSTGPKTGEPEVPETGPSPVDGADQQALQKGIVGTPVSGEADDNPDSGDSNTDSPDSGTGGETDTTNISGVPGTTTVAVDAFAANGGIAHYVRRNDGKRLTGVRAAAAGKNHVLFLLSTGHVTAMGVNDFGQLGNGANTPSDTTGSLVTVVDASAQPIKHIVAVAAGDNHSLALSREGVVYAWGDGSAGQLGDGSNVSSFVAVAVRDSYNRPFNIRYSCEPLF